MTAPIAHPTISWLKRHEPRGKPLPPIRFNHFTFGRVIQPDPDDPVQHRYLRRRQGRSLRQLLRAARTRGRTAAAAAAGSPRARSAWEAVRGADPALQRLRRRRHHARNGVSHRRPHRAGGLARQRLLGGVPETELPGRIVGYNAKNQVAGIVDLPGNAVATPCPVPSFTKPVSALPSPRPWEHIDLATLSVNGHRILGLTPQEVEAALGKPTTTRPNAQITNGVSIPEFRYGGSLPSTYGLSVGFSKKGDRIFANSLSFQSPSLVDAKLGHVLRTVRRRSSSGRSRARTARASASSSATEAIPASSPRAPR